MFLIRESFEEDADQILEIAQHLDTVNLPADRTQIQRILKRSVDAFSGAVPPAEREYFFVLEDKSAGRVVGTSMIHGQHGTRRSPHVFLQVFADERYSETLDKYMVHECLRLGYNYDGPTEIGGLILLPEYRGHAEKLGRFLSYVRFLFIAMHRPDFRDQVISELLPPLEPDGTSRLWKHFGRRFTGLDYATADHLSKDNKEFIKSLFPHGFIYTSLFPEEVQADIGAVGAETVGVEKMLRRIGFTFANTIDPFDGGPHFVADTDSITLVRDARTVKLSGSGTTGNTWAIVACESGPAGPHPRFRACTTTVDSAAGPSVAVGNEVLATLGAEEGAEAWMVTA